ncbi:MAG: hypothetical protein EOO57_02785 [Hymenobacter sp.]|nr:MAG: hypothetical protein EOO57_02785 [Hymenobacter sp.]
MQQSFPPAVSSQYDLLGYSTNGQLRLIVELKGRVQVGATRLAGEWLSRVSQQQPRLYALFITPEFMLLRLPMGQQLPSPVAVAFTHQQVVQQLLERLPGQFDYAVNSVACLDTAIDTQRMPLHKLTAGGLERVVTSWLNSTLLLSATELQQQTAQAWLVESGLHEALANGTIVVTPAGPYAYGFAA